MHTSLEGLASQMLVAIETERATYVGLDSDGSSLVTTPTVLVFSASRLSVENPYHLQSQRGNTLQDLVGLTVAEAFWTVEELVILFAGGERFAVSLRDSDFVSPEAAVYAPSHGPIVVFN